MPSIALKTIRTNYKKLLLWSTLILSSYLGLAQSGNNIIISENFEHANFQEFMERLEANYGVQFFYDSLALDSIEISRKYNLAPLDLVLRGIFHQHNVNFYINNQQQIFLFNKSFKVVDIPNYVQKENGAAESEKTNSLSNQESAYLEGRKPDALQEIEVGKKSLQKPGKTVYINGKIEDNESGEPLIGATVYIEELGKGAATDINGNLSLALLPGSYKAKFSCLGMANANCILQVYSDGFFKLPMNRSALALKEVTVNAEENKRSSRVGMEKVTIKSIKSLPVLLGEKDIVKISQMLPGIVSVNEGSSGVNVRGGNADQNLFYLNDIPIYNTSHLFGFFSAINSSIVKDFSIYKAYVPVEYGGRLSSVFSVKTRKGNKKKFFMQGGISPVTANIELEAPIVKDKASFVLSARSTYSDWLLKRINNPDINNSKANFYDFSGGVDYIINNNNNVNVFFNYSHDYFSLNQLTDYGYTNAGLSANFTHHFSPKFNTYIALTASEYSFETIDQSTISAAYKHDYKIDHYEFKAKANWLLNEKHTLTAGGNAINYQLNRGKVLPYGEESNKAVVNLGEEFGIETGFFLEDTYTPREWLTLNAGLRFSSFYAMGPRTVYTYLAGSPREDSYIKDTTSYGKNEVIQSYHNPELRLASQFKLSPLSSVKLSYTQMTQYMFMLSNTISIGQNDQWKMVDSHITPPKLWQVSMGYYQKILAWQLELSSEIYYKQASNIVEYKDGADFIGTPNVETTLLQGDQDSYGFEFMLSKPNGKLNGWASYAYSRSFVQVDGENTWDKINKGKVYPSNYDKPHVVNLIANYNFSRRFTLSTNMTYSTGRPITYPKSVFYIEGSPYIEYSDRNMYRIPDYFRVDVSITVDGNLKKEKSFHSYWTASIYNLTGRNNASSIYFQTENSRITAYQYSVIGVPIFTLSWNIKLGNYTNE